MRQTDLFGEDERAKRRSSADHDPTFSSRVHEIVRQIPSGMVTTYGAIATALGDRRGARMVGWAMSNCPSDVAALAHRVVNRHGELSGGWAWGHPDVMRALLAEEGVTFRDDYRVDLERHLWIPPMKDDMFPERAR